MQFNFHNQCYFYPTYIYVTIFNYILKSDMLSNSIFHNLANENVSNKVTKMIQI